MIKTEHTFRAPLYVAWEITHKCNARCLHCYSDSGPLVSCSEDLSTDEALSVIDQLAEAGLMVLAFSGGEPMLRKDWPVLVGHAVEKGLSVNVGSNGSSITLAIADRLKALGVKSVTISLDSHKAETHDFFRQCPGLFKKAVRAITLLVERGIRVVVGFTPTKINYKDGPGVIELAQSLGAHAVNLSEFVPAGRGSVTIALTPDELREVLTHWIRLRQLFAGRIDIMWHDCRVGLLAPEEEQRDYLGCGAGRLLARICPDGRVTPCVFLPTVIGSLREQSFQSIWNDSLLLGDFRKRTKISGNCGDCEHLSTCGGCRAVAYAYSCGDPLAGDPQCWINVEFRPRLHDLASGEGLPI